MKKMAGFAFLLILLGTACAQSDDTSIRAAIENMNRKFQTAITTNDYQAIADMYTEDAVSLPNYEPMMTGKMAILEGNKKMFETGMKVNSADFKTIQILGTGDTRIEIGQFQMSIRMPNSSDIMNENGKYVNVWMKQPDGSWKLKADIWNSDSNPLTIQAGAKSKGDDSTDRKEDR